MGEHNLAYIYDESKDVEYISEFISKKRNKLENELFSFINYLKFSGITSSKDDKDVILDKFNIFMGEDLGLGYHLFGKNNEKTMRKISFSTKEERRDGAMNNKNMRSADTLNFLKQSKQNVNSRYGNNGNYNGTQLTMQQVRDKMDKRLLNQGFSISKAIVSEREEGRL